MSDEQYPRKGAYLAAWKQIAKNARTPEPTPWWAEFFAALRRWTVQA